MEKRLYNYIMRPAMMLTWAFGLVLIYLIGFEVFKFMDANQIGVGIIFINLS